MEKNKTLCEYLDKIKKLTDKKLRKMRVAKRNKVNFEKEDYHKLRMAIKKWKGLIDLIEFKNSDFNEKKYFHPLKKVFKESGKVRESQLELLMMKKYKQLFNLNDFFNYLNSEIKKQEKEFYNSITEIRMHHIQKTWKKIKPWLKGIKNEDINGYLEKQKRKVECVIDTGEPLQPVKIHELRKLLKTDYYNRQLLNIKPVKAIFKNEKSFLDLLGKWHEYRTTNRHLEKSILQGNLDIFYLNQLLSIKEEMSFDERILFKKEVPY